MKWFIVVMILLVVLIAGCASVSCPISSERYCVNDSDCMCSTSPCFLGNKEYFEKCVPDKTVLGACLDACGFGPYEMEFRYICENSQCAIATFNRTTGQRITYQTPNQEPNPEIIPSNPVNVPESFCKGTARCLNGTVTKITDGDTLEVDDTSVRLALVDAPEYGRAGYENTKELASSICPIGSTVIVDEDDGQNESYGRIVAVVYCGGINLNAMMTNNEYVSIDTSYCSVSEFANEEWSGC